MIRRDHRTPTPSGVSGKGSRHAWVMGLGLAATLAFAGVAAAQSPSLVPPDKRPATQVTDDEGTVAVFAADPGRVVSLSPANTEIVFALGAGDRLVGGTDFDDYPPEAAALPDVVSQTKVLTEQIVALQPELILAGGNGLTPPDDIAHLRDLGYPVVVLYPETVDEVLGDITLIGDALGGDAAATAQETVSEMGTDIETVSGLTAATTTRPRTLYEISFGPDLYAPAPNSFIANLVQLGGGDPVTTGDPAVFSLPTEQLLVADPQVIVLGDALYGTCPDAVAVRPGWDVISAVRDGAIRPVNDTIITRPGPRLADGLASLTRAIHPELAPQLADFPADSADVRRLDLPRAVDRGRQHGARTQRMSTGLATGTRVAVRTTHVRRRPVSVAAGGVVLLAVAAVAGVVLGNVSLPIGDTLGILGHRILGLPAGVWPASSETIVVELRLPRVLTAMIVGMGLGIAGAVLQGLLRNPLADPYVLGTASGAALGAAVGVLLPVEAALLGFGLANALAFVGALAAVALVVRISGGDESRSSVLLVGYAVGSILAAGLALAMYLSGDELRRIVSFLLGSFANASWTQVAVGVPVIGVGTLLIVSRARSWTHCCWAMRPRPTWVSGCAANGPSC